MPPVITRIFGPYKHNGGWRCQIEVNGSRRWAPMADDPQRAEQRARFCIDQVHAVNPVTIGDAIEQYRSHLETKGNKPDSINATHCRMVLFFESALGLAVNQMTQGRAAALYERLRTTPSKRTGKLLSPDTHRNMLSEAKSFLNWCIDQRWLRANPLTPVKGIGKRRHGKPQLRIDEARKLRDLCHGLAAAGDDGAVAVLMGLLMGMRAGEIVSRTAHDLDNGGTLLWIPDAKTEAGKRTVEVPEELQPYLLARCEGKPHNALIFPARRSGKHWRDWVREETHRLCGLAGIPSVTAHSLRGFVATVAIQKGGMPQMVAAALGHVSPTTTLQSYALPGSAQQAQQRHVLDLLGRNPSPPSSPTAPN